jgi:hypothetical protein
MSAGIEMGESMALEHLDERDSLMIRNRRQAQLPYVNDPAKLTSVKRQMRMYWRISYRVII